jgi:hypothetical protein
MCWCVIAKPVDVCVCVRFVGVGVPIREAQQCVGGRARCCHRCRASENVPLLLMMWC